MRNLIIYLFVTNCMAAPFAAAAQNATYLKLKSETSYDNKQFDSAIYYAKLAEPFIIDTFTKNSLEYAWFAGQYYGMNYEELYNIDSALYWYKYHINMCEAFHDTTSSEYGETLTNCGNLLNTTGAFTAAYPYLQKAVIVLKRYPEDVKGYLGSKNNLANYYQYTGEYFKAETVYRECLEEINQRHLKLAPIYIGTLMINLAKATAKCGYITEAEKLFKQGLDTLRTIDAANEKYFESLNNLAALYMDNDNYTQAGTILQEVFKNKYKRTDSSQFATSRYEAGYALSLNYLGNIQEATHHKEDALRLYRQAFANANQLRISPYVKYLSIANLADFYASQHLYVKADSLFNTVIPQMTTGNDKDDYTYTKIYADYCKNLLHLKQYVKAAEYIQSFTQNLLTVLYKNIGGMPAENQMSYIASIENYLGLMFSTIATNPAPQKGLITFALNNLLHYKGLVLSTQIERTKSLRSTSDTLLNKLSLQLKITKEILYYENTANENRHLNIDSLQSVARDYERKISSITGVNYNYLNTLPVGEITSKLNGKSAALEFVYYPDVLSNTNMYGVFILHSQKTEPEFIKLCSDNQMNECLGYVKGKSFYPQQQLDNYEKLYQLVWKPVEQKLSGTDTIYYSPAGMLHYVAFDALKLKAKPEEDLLHNKFFVLMPGTQNLVKRQSQYEAIAAAVLWGNIDCSAMAYINSSSGKAKQKHIYRLPDAVTKGGNSLRFPPLPPDELPQIKMLAKEKNLSLKVYEKDDATEENFKQDAASYEGLLHISSHGFFYNQPIPNRKNTTSTNAFISNIDPLLRCGLVLKGGNYAWSGKTPKPGREDGILTGYEIALLDLSKVKLVVLSACETGLGDIAASSEGVLGLQRAFKLAGVDNMVLSLWSIPATATKELMVSFYTHLLNKQTPANALRLAKLQMAEKNPPYNWAGFVLVE